MALTQVHESIFIGSATNSVSSPVWNSKNIFVRRDRKWSRWVSIKFYLPPVFSLCDLILKPNKLGHGVCRSESFRYMEKNQFIPSSKLKANNEGVGFPGCIKNRIDLCETYAEPLDVLPHSGLWKQQLSVPRPEREDLDLISNNSQLDRIKITIKEQSYHEEVESFNGKQDNCFIPYYSNDADAPPFYLPQIHDNNNYKKINGNRQRTPGLEENCDFDIDETRLDPFLAYLNSSISRRDTKIVQNHEHKTFPVNFHSNNNYYSNIEPFHTKSRKVRETHRARYSKNKTRHKFRKGGGPARTRASASVESSISSICSSSSQHPHQQQSRALTHCCCSHDHDSRSHSRSHNSMARKRYETAFLPSSSSTSDANLQSPDVDTLLLAIEGTSLTDVLDHNREKNRHHHHHHHQSEDNHQSLIMRHHRHLYNETDDDHDPRSILSSSHHRQVSTSHSRTTSPSPYQLQFEEVHVHHHQQQHHEYSSSNSNSSSPQRHSSCRVGSRGNLSETEESHSNSLCSPRKLVSPNPNLPLSEPLPVKRYSNVSSCRGSKHQGHHGPSDKRILIKDNSISSLESLDSTKSDDLQLLRQQHFPFSRSVGGQGGGGGQSGSGGPFFGKTPKSKLLSPISDKSPLEPKSLSQLHSVGIDFGNGDSSSKIDTDDIHSSTISKPRDSVTTSTLDAWDWSNNKNILSAAELTNVPWEMPKLRRKLALMADSGISLDLPPPPHPQILSINPSLEAGHFTSRNRTMSSDFFSRPPPSGQFGVLGEEKLALASTSSKIGNPPLAKCDNFSLKKPDGGFSSSAQKSEGNNCNDSSQWEKRGNLDLKLPLKIGREDDNNYMGGGYYHGNDNEIGGNYLPSSNKPDRYKVWLDFNGGGGGRNPVKIEFDPTLELESQDWFYGAITRSEAENVLRPTKEGSFLVRNCESSNFNQYSLSLKCVRGFIHIRIEPNSLGTFSLGDQEFPSVPHLVLHFMTHRLPIKGAEHVKLIYPVINQLL